jgi:cytochrome d ubiquinol oxidase subunit I
MGRQPWIVYGLMKTTEAVSPISAGQIIFSLGGLITFYTILLVADFYLLIKFAKKGPINNVGKQNSLYPETSMNRRKFL